MTQTEEEQLLRLFNQYYIKASLSLFEKRQVNDIDFTFNQPSGKRIGIELTEAFIDGKTKGRVSFNIEFTEMVLEEIKKIISFPFFIDIDIDEKVRIPKNKRNDLAKETAKFCFKEYSGLENHQFWEVLNIDMDLEAIENAVAKKHILNKGYRNLPRGIESIQMGRVDEIDSPWNSQGEGGIIPDFTDKYLAPILRKKEDCLKSYSLHDEYWLVIKEGNYYPGCFHRIFINETVNTSFSKVFVYRIMDNEVVVLK